MRAIYAFSGDPITNGHLDIVQRAARTYAQVVVGIGENPQKTGKYLFEREERLALAKMCLGHLPNVECVAFTGLLGEYAYRHGFDVIVRGVRNNSDLEGELVQFAVADSLHPTVDTVFFPTHHQLSHISSGVVKAIVAEGGDVSDYCHLGVKEALEKRILRRFSLGVAGGIAAGKTVVAKNLVAALGDSVKAEYISLDAIGHYVLSPSDESIYQDTRDRICRRFGDHMRRDDGSIDRKKLGPLVFADPAVLTDLNRIMHEPMLARLYQETRHLQDGVVVLEGAILVESCWSKLVNNNVLLVDAPEETRLERLLQRNGMDREEAMAKITRQMPAAERQAVMTARIEDQGWGRIWEIENDGEEEQLAAKIAAVAAEVARLAQDPPPAA